VPTARCNAKSHCILLASAARQINARWLAKSGVNMPPLIPLFDGHNDALLRLLSCTDPVASFQDCSGNGQLDLGMARRAGLVGGLFACFVPPNGARNAGLSLTPDGYSVEMPEPPTLAEARRQTDAMIACARRLEAGLPEQVGVCLNVPDIRRSLAANTIAMVLQCGVLV